MDENNQYGQVMTKPLPCSCIKNVMKTPTLLEFNGILDIISDEHTIGHLFIADMKFHNKNPKAMPFNYIYPPIFEKNKTIRAHEKSTILLVSVLNRNVARDIINSFKCSSKTHSTLDDKKFIPLKAEHLHFLIKRVGWLVTKICEHYTFEEAKFKQDFVLMNQKAKQKATSTDFYKLLNNANFGIDCRNNMDNCKLEPICDEIGEISYIKRFDTIFGNDGNYRSLYSPQIERDEINQKYNALVLCLDKNDPAYEARKGWYQAKKEEDLDSIDSLEARLEKNGKTRKYLDIDAKIGEAVNSNRTKVVLEFNCQGSASVKSFTVKQSDCVKLTTRFLSGKMLMFAKLSLIFFIYEMLKTFCFPDKKVQKIFKKYQIEKVHIYHVLTDTDSTCLKFLFVNDPNSEIPESKYTEINFEVIIASGIYNGFDSSHEYWENFNAREGNLGKCLKIEHIGNPCILSIASIIQISILRRL